MGKVFATDSVSEISKFIETVPFDIVVVCGFDNVGKGRVLDTLSKGSGPDNTDLPVFHPDYSLICDQVAKSGRWSYFMYFMDVYNSFKSISSYNYPMIFDRSALCGAIYNNDYKIAVEYANRLKDNHILHVLVTCDEDSYNKFVGVRNSEATFSYKDYLVYTERYRCYMDILGIDYIEFLNKYDDTFGDYASKVCGGCGHFKSNKCINPMVKNKNVTFDTERCKYSSDKEVQDCE